MKFIWFKSDEGDVLEDCGIVIAESESEARSILYEEYGYDATYQCISFMNLDMEIDIKEENKEQVISIFKLFDRQK